MAWTKGRVCVSNAALWVAESCPFSRQKLSFCILEGQRLETDRWLLEKQRFLNAQGWADGGLPAVGGMCRKSCGIVWRHQTSNAQLRGGRNATTWMSRIQSFSIVHCRRGLPVWSGSAEEQNDDLCREYSEEHT